MSKHHLFVCCASVLLSAMSIKAQTAGTGTLVGTVTDSTGAIVAGAKVIVLNADTAFRSESVTSAEGAY